MDLSQIAHTKPTLGVKIASIFFAVTGLLLALGFIKAVMEIPEDQTNFHIYLVYIFLISICFLISFSLYKHKQWALYVAYALLLYLVINFILNLNNSLSLDVIIAGIPLIAIIVAVIYLLIRKHNHFIH